MNIPLQNKTKESGSIFGRKTHGIRRILTLLPLLLFFIIPSGFAGQPSKDPGVSWSLSGGVGTSFLTFEVADNFEFLPNEFTHKPAMMLDLGISARLREHFEPTVRLGLMSLYGKAKTPDFSAVGNHFSLNELYELPVEYSTKGASVSGLIRFYFRKSSGQKSGRPMVNPFIEAGGGLTFFNNELRYKSIPPDEESALIFQKGKGKQPLYSVGHYLIGTGVKIGKPGQSNFYVLYSGNVVNYDFMDGVHNYTDGARNHAKGVVSKITAGVIVPLSGGKRESSGHSPWAPVPGKF